MDIGNASFPDELKYALRKRYGDFVKTRLDTEAIPYLEGLRDAGVSGADDLIQLIAKNGRYEIWEES